MRMDEALYASFLEELQALEKFRLGYTALHPAAPLDGEDADVRRLTEAMALFTARTRRAGQRALEKSTLRLFQQHFAYLLNPVPAMAMVRAEPDARFVDAAELPRGTPFLLNPGEGGGPPGRSRCARSRRCGCCRSGSRRRGWSARGMMARCCGSSSRAAFRATTRPEWCGCTSTTSMTSGPRWRCSSS